MAYEWVTDSSGERMWMKRIHKDRFVGKPFPAHTIENMVHVPLRSDDIMLCSYPKSGCHWLWENLRILQSGEMKRDAIGKVEMMMEYFEHGHFDDKPSPRILNNHVYFDDQPSDLLKGNTKLILVYRNPKDIAVSFYYHQSKIPSYKYKGEFQNYMKRFVEGKVSSNCCFDYWNMWEEGLAQNPQIPYLLVRYEDFHQNPISERRRIAAFIGREYDDTFLQSVTDFTSIDSMKQMKAGASLKDNQGQSIFYRKGLVGDWKHHFTVSQSEWFDREIEAKMKDSKLFKFVYSID